MDIFRTAVLGRKQAPCGCKHTDVPINGLGQCHVTHSYTVVIMYCRRVLHSVRQTREERLCILYEAWIALKWQNACQEIVPHTPLSFSLLP
jgi:hypothetical protein